METGMDTKQQMEEIMISRQYKWNKSRNSAFRCGALSVVLFGALLVSSQGAWAEEISASASEGVAITIYNQNFGLVKDVRKVALDEGINSLRFSDVAAAIDPTTVSFTSLTSPNAVVVREQNYQYDVMDPQTILSKSTGKTVTFRRVLDSGQVRETTGELLNSPVATVVDINGNASRRTMGLVLKTDSGIVLNPGGETVIDSLPEGLVSKPSLLWKLESTKAGEHRTEISYQTRGLNWKCDYVAVSNDDDTAADLTSWVTIDNKSGATYKRAALKLLAGDVHKVQQPAPMRRMAMMKSMAQEAAPQFKEQSFAEYHLYSLQGKTDVRDNETKQMSLFNAAQVPVKKLFIYEPYSHSFFPYQGSSTGEKKVNVKLELANTEKNHLGIPLPKGKVRVYKRDSDGAMQFVGEDLIDHTPRDEKVRLYVGDAFDLVGEHKQTNYERVSTHLTRVSYEISLRNHKDSAVDITAVEHAFGDWKVISESHKHKKKDSSTFEYTVNVPADGEVKITYQIEIRT